MAAITQGERLARVEVSLEHFADCLNDLTEEMKLLRGDILELKVEREQRRSRKTDTIRIAEVIRPYIVSGILMFAVAKGVPLDTITSIFTK